MFSQVENLSVSMVEAMKREIEEIDWMDQKTKSTALLKVGNDSIFST